jgi:outer membrane protein, heavy metal efflux system
MGAINQIMNKGIRLAIVFGLIVVLGCQSSKPHRFVTSRAPQAEPIFQGAADTPDTTGVQLASLHQAEKASELPAAQSDRAELVVPEQAWEGDTLADLEAWAISNNPILRRLRHEAAAEWAQAAYIDKLPDPTLGAMAYTPPMNFDPDRQLAEVQIMQMIPWIGRLKAEAQRADLEALAAVNLYQAERLQVIGDIRVAWYKLYVLHKQVETTEADKAQLESLLSTANARIRTGDAQPGDVLLATLELSNLQEQLISYRREIVSTEAEINRLAGRDSQAAIAQPEFISPDLPAWDHEFLRALALTHQPELNAARLQVAATRWGIEVARLKRRPDLTFGLGCMVMDAPGAVMPDAGEDSWTLGVTTTIPLWHRKYDAMVSEASREHYAAHASEDEVALQIDSLLRDLWEQALASQRTVELYENTILPQARQTFAADQASLINNTVTFDRVIRDYRTLLTLELGYHKALGQLATALARIRQAVGLDIVAEPQS